MSDLQKKGILGIISFRVQDGNIVWSTKDSLREKVGHRIHTYQKDKTDLSSTNILSQNKVDIKLHTDFGLGFKIKTILGYGRPPWYDKPTVVENLEKRKITRDT